MSERVIPGERDLLAEIESLLGHTGDDDAAREPAAAARTVLVVDDNLDYRSAIAFVLKEKNISVLEAADGAEGLRLALRSAPDLILLDFNMPKMNGYEFLQELRANPETRTTAVIMFTGAPNRRHLKEMNLDVVDFLEKPLANRVLLEHVLKALGAAERLPAPAAVPATPAPAPAPEPQPEPVPPEETLSADESLLEMVDCEAERKLEEQQQGLEDLADDSPLIRRVNQILVQAVALRASDIHIEPQEDATAVRLRVDGTLRPLCTIPRSLHARLSTRVKIMAGLVITERRVPQDGMFQAQIKGQKVEFRVSTLPSAYGEKIVLRVLGKSKLGGDLSGAGFSARELACVEQALKTPHGLVLVTGPTGSGKTTTLYRMIGALNRPDVNILTAEDPVEYRLPGITQVQIKNAVGLTFEKALRAFLRQDPDIMLVGEIRDLETAEIAVKASITGHLVFSTLHTNSAPATIARLAHMGLAPFLIAASVKLVIAQRLVKALCPACKKPSALGAEEARFLTEAEAARLGSVFSAPGCASCRQSGCAGRRPIFEVMPVLSADLREAVQNGASADELGRLARQEGMTTLRESALAAAANGETSLTEAFKVILGESR